MKEGGGRGERRELGERQRTARFRSLRHHYNRYFNKLQTVNKTNYDQTASEVRRRSAHILKENATLSTMPTDRIWRLLKWRWS